MEWIHYTNIGDIQPEILFDIFKLRQDVFIIEQECIYPDIDELDLFSGHVTCHIDDSLAGYLRIVPAGKKYTVPSLGRIVTSNEFRGIGLGKELVRYGLKLLKKKGENRIKIEAQTYLKKFYSDLGFKSIGQPFILDGIEHVEMERLVT